MLRFRLPQAYQQTGSTLYFPRAVGISVPGSLWGAIEGFRVPWLTDVLSDPAYGSNDRAAALSRFLSSWQQQLHTAWHEQHAAFALRMFWDPTRGSIELYGLTRCMAEERHLADEAEHAKGLLATMLANYEWPIEPLVDSQIEAICRPSWVQAAAEVRQGETLYPIRVGQESLGIYAILPFAEPRGDWRDLLGVITSQPEPLIINLHLQPTRLSVGEYNAISTTATTAKRMVRIEVPGRTRQHSFANPQAETAFRIYSTLEKRLEQPFLAAAHVFARSDRVADAVGHALGSAIVSRDVQGREAQAEEIPSAYVCTLAQREFWSSVEAVLSYLWFAPTSRPSYPPPQGRDRLRYLVDSRGGAALFRPPVPRETGLPGIEVRKRQGGHEVGRRVSKLPKNHVLLGHQSNGHVISIDAQELKRHGLICGTPGSGKTNTSLNLLAQIWRDHRIPFWVFEPPKTEYRGLLKQPGFEDLLVFTVGDESTAPLRLNPFELPPEISVDQHILNLRTCFEAGLPKIDESGQLLGMFIEGAVRDAYRANGWRNRDTAESGKEPPSLYQLLPQVNKALQTYTGDIRTNLEAAIGNRLRGLLRGSKGRMFNVTKGVPIEHLMSRPVIFELLPMGADAPLTLMFLLNLLREHASERRKSHPLGVEHVTMVEEAHVIMARGDGQQHGTNAGVATAFENILAELRSAGEGVLIAEQTPTKLIKGAINLTSLKIVHKLVGNEEVNAVGGAMTATEEQKGTFQRLSVGEAGFFKEDSQGVSFFRAPNFMGESRYEDRLPRSEVRKAMAAYFDKHPWLRLPFQGCTLCRSECRYRDDVRDVLNSSVRQMVDGSLVAWEKAEAQASITSQRTFYGTLASVAAASGHTGVPDAAWCVWVQTVDEIDEDFIFSRDVRREFEAGLGQSSGASP